MGQMPFYGTLRAVRAWRRAGLAQGRLGLRSFGALTALVVLVFMLVPAGASAEPLCTDTWTGASEGEWSTAGEWSTGKVPSASDVACIGAGKTVKVAGGTNQTGVVQGSGALVISSGSLEVSNALEASVMASLTLSGGTLTGAGTLEVSKSFAWSGESKMSGSGSTVVQPSASGTIGTGNPALAGRTFGNEGSLVLVSGTTFHESEGAHVKNAGTFDVQDESSPSIATGAGAAPLFVNTGTFERTKGSEATTISVNFENVGTAKAQVGKFVFPSGINMTLTSGSVLEGTIFFEGASVTGNSFQAKNGTVTLASGTLNISSGSTAKVTSFSQKGGTLTGAGTLNITESLSWSESSTMSGSGSTVVQSGATGTIGKGNPELTARSLVNEGSIILPTGTTLHESEGAVIKNLGTFDIQDESSPSITVGGSVTAPSFVNTGTVERTKGAGATEIAVNFENTGTLKAQVGQFGFPSGIAVTLAGGSILEGSIVLEGATVTGGSFQAKNTVTLSAGTLSITSGSTAKLSGYSQTGGTLTGAGALDVSGSFSWSGGDTMSGSGSTVVQASASGTIGGGNPILTERSLINEGSIVLVTGTTLHESEGAQVRNLGTFDVQDESSPSIALGGATIAPSFVNLGLFEKTKGASKTKIEPNFENLGSVLEQEGHFEFSHPIVSESSTQYGDEENPGHPHPTCGKPVSCATGNESETQTDLTVGGRGVGLDLTRYYNSQAAAAGEHGVFGYGWTSSFSDHLVVEKASKKATLVQADGSTVVFAEGGGGSFTAPAWTQDTLSGTSEAGYTLTLADQAKFKFAGATGRFESVTDRNGNATTLAYEAKGHIETISDPAGRKITFVYNAEGLVESSKDPMGHTAKYTYEGGNLASVTEPGEVSARWQFKYDGSHQLTEMTDGRAGKTINEYNGSHQLVSQEDPMEHQLTFEYEPFHTKITNHATGSITDEHFTSNDEPSSITRGYGTASATTESFTYNAGGYVTSLTDGNGHVTTYGYDSENNRTSMIDPNHNETKWTYDSKHDVETMTTPKGETTTIKRESHGNPETISRPAPKETTQTTKYTYDAHGDLETMTDPLSRVWKYEYDTYGDRTAEIDPETDKRTWGYNEDSQQTSMVSPRGHVKVGEEAKYTTKIELDSQGRPLTVTDPLGHTTKYTYDGDGNIETVTDGNLHKTTYTYNADNEQTKVKLPSGITTETVYDGEGHVITQLDGSKHETKYVRNAVGEVTEIIDPLGRKTTKEYDSAGNLKTLTDPAKRTTTYTYDPGKRLTEISYSDGKTHTLKYEYDADGDRTKMTDGTGTTTYEYDQLDRLTESKDGHGDVVKYEYDLANQQKKITYPGGKSVTRTYDKAGRLQSVLDWLEHTTKFAYDADSDLVTTTFPTATSNVDKNVYNAADQTTEVKMTKGAETLASLVYARENVGQVKTITSKGLPGEEKPGYTYDENNRLTKGGATAYEYDTANNTTKIGTGSYTYDKASELETGPSLKYTYDELGERTKTTPTAGPATTYGYDESGNLISVTRPEEGATPKIEDTYAYDGAGLRASQTINGTTSYLTWEMSEELPLLLNDGTNSYVYGPGGLPIEQITGEKVLYLHHDQQGSTRLLTGSTGTIEGSYTFDAYGNQTGHTGTTASPLGYDGQYTNSDTGLVYLRARVYDPSTAQFLTVDPLAPITRAHYNYAEENPLTYDDPAGLLFGLDLPSLEEVGTRVVGFVDGFTSPVFGGTAALRSDLGLNGELDTCSIEYQVASNIGGLDASLEAGAAAGGLVEGGIDALGGIRVGAVKLGPIIAPLAGGAVGGAAQTYVAGHQVTPTSVAEGAAGGFAGELATGLVPGTSASGAAGAVSTGVSFAW